MEINMSENFYGILYGEKFTDKEQTAYAVAHSLISGRDLLGAAVTPETLSAFIKKKEFDGLIVSPEFGKAVMPLVSKTSPAARACGAVDVILKTADGRLYGDNTAIPAFSYLLESILPSPIIQKCLILGNGSDAAAVRYVLEQRVKDETSFVGEIVTVTEKGRNNFLNLSQHADATLLINTLPTSFELPFFLSELPVLEAVIDINLSPLSSKLILQAQSLGISASNGVPMTAARIKAANELFLGVRADSDILPPVISAINSRLMTVTLLSPDESLAKAVAPMLGEALGKKSFDIASVIEKLYTKTIDEIKALSGPRSNEFDRSLRVAVSWAAKRNGCIICAPAEIAEKPEYRDMLAANGPIVGIVKPEETAEQLDGFCDILVQISSAAHAEIAVEAIRAELQI